MIDSPCPSLEGVERVFSQNGLLNRALAGYEMRKEQKDMSLEVMGAYKEGKILLVEAATGVGKSWAYLVPALIWASSKKIPTVISTHTIALQEQLIYKDIPFLLNVLGLDLQATLVKGMGNYFCFKKHEEACLEKVHLSAEEQLELERLEQFSRTSEEGSLSDVNFPLSSITKEKVAAERFSCTHVECPHFRKCFFFKARKQLAESQILIVNHHLLVADLAARLRPDFQEEKSVLPIFSRFVLDEAHHLEEIALESFSIRISRLEIVRYLGRIYSEIQPQKSQIGLLKAALSIKKKQIPSSCLLLLDIEIPAQKREALEAFNDFLEEVELFCEQELLKEQSVELRDKKWRFSPEKLSSLKWCEDVQGKFLLLQEAWNKFFLSIDLLKKELVRAFSIEDKEFFSSYFLSFDAISSVLQQRLEQLQAFVLTPFDEHSVRWVEASGALALKNLTLVNARLNVAEHLKKLLFSSKETGILCSATMTSNKNFTFLKGQLGLTSKELEARTSEKMYDSPFDFQKNALFLVPKDFPYPHEFGFFDCMVDIVKKIIRASKGGCFILFTSYEMLQSCYDKIVGSIDSPKLSYLRQGECSRQMLVERFKERQDSVLFATSSFWEGIDIAGETLRCVILIKLPFKVPGEPLFQAMSEMYQRGGKDPFVEYSLPQACLKFKQGFGRLIRTKTDRGCVVCLDKRIMTKSYGKVFLSGIPSCPISYKKGSELIKDVEAFYLKSV